MSRCCSPLISIASKLSIEHRTAGKVTSNCISKGRKESKFYSENVQFILRLTLANLQDI